jgi:hypothetical protein
MKLHHSYGLINHINAKCGYSGQEPVGGKARNHCDIP